MLYKCYHNEESWTKKEDPLQRRLQRKQQGGYERAKNTMHYHKRIKEEHLRDVKQHSAEKLRVTEQNPFS